MLLPLVATTLAVLNMACAVANLPAAVWALAVVVNVGFVGLGLIVGDLLVWAPHLALVPLNATLFIGRARSV